MADSGVISTALTVCALIGLFTVSLYALILLSKRWRSVVKDRLITALKRRRNDNDPFRSTYGYCWDYIIAFRVYDEEDYTSDVQCQYSMRYILQRLSAGGMEVRLFYSLSKRQVFCKIRCSLSRLQKHADLVDYKLQLDPVELRKVCKAGREGLWDPLKVPDECEETHLSPYEHIFARFEFDDETQRTSPEMMMLYKRYPRLRLDPDEIAALGDLAGEFAANDDDDDDDATSGSPGSNGGLARNPMVPHPSMDFSASAVGGESAIELLDVAAGAAAGADGGGEEEEDNDDDGPKLTTRQEAQMFRGVDRMKLMNMIIESKGPGGCGLDIRQLMKDEAILTYMPLHDMVELRALESNWLKFFAWPWNQPVDQIKDYFGEKIGLYFKWLGLYTTWLSLAALMGGCFWINVATNGNDPNTQSVPYFAGLMAIWSVVFLEHWKRTEKNTAMKWGTIGFESTEQVRPQFEGETIRSPVNGRPVLYYPDELRKRKRYYSSAVINAWLTLVVAVVAAIFALRIAIRSTGANIGGVQLASLIASILLALQVQVFNQYFSDVALDLNNRENHRTDTEYEDALIAKTFSFQFINSYISLFYIGFLKPFIPNIDPCLNLNCLEELQTTLGTIFIMRVTIGNLTELGMPMLNTHYRNAKLDRMAQKRFDNAGVTDLRSVPDVTEDGLDLGEIVGKQELGTMEHKADMSEIEHAFNMEHYDVMLGTFEDFAEMVIQFGYTTMFVAAFPLATVMSFVNNYVEIRVDAWKLCQLMQRAEPRSAEDIGTWQDILEFISIAAIAVNSMLVAFTSTNMIDTPWFLRAWTFVLMAAGLFVIRTLIAFIIPDEPEWVDIQVKRQEYIVGKVIDNIEDEDDDALLKKTNFKVPNYLIDATDFDPM